MQGKVARALVVALALGLGACGGSKPLTATALRARANAVCEHVNAEIVALERTATTVAKTRKALIATGHALDRGLRELDTLTPPSALQAQYERFKSAFAAHRDAAVELSKPHPHLSAAARRTVDEHHNSLDAAQRALGVSGCY